MKKGTLAVAAVVFLLGGTVFAQDIIANFTFGGMIGSMENTDVYGRTYKSSTDMTTLAVDVLIIGKTGLTVSLETDIGFKMHKGVAVNPIIGLGYVYSRKGYIGGILNLTGMPVLQWYENGELNTGDVIVAPTLVVGYDLDFFVLSGYISYLHGVVSPVSGFRGGFGVGVKI